MSARPARVALSTMGSTAAMVPWTGLSGIADAVATASPPIRISGRSCSSTAASMRSRSRSTTRPISCPSVSRSPSVTLISSITPSNGATTVAFSRSELGPRQRHVRFFEPGAHFGVAQPVAGERLAGDDGVGHRVIEQAEVGGGELGRGLLHVEIERAQIDLDEGLPLAHSVAGAHQHFADRALGLALDHRGLLGADLAGGDDREHQVALAHLLSHDRQSERGARCRLGRVGCGRRFGIGILAFATDGGREQRQKEWKIPPHRPSRPSAPLPVLSQRPPENRFDLSFGAKVVEPCGHEFLFRARERIL